MRRLALLPLLLATVALPACTEGVKAAREARDRPLHVTCYSGGIIIVDDVSTQDVTWGESGIYYRSQTTQRLVKAGADCVVVDEDLPKGWKPLLPGRTR